MIGLPAGTRIWLVAGMTDMRCGLNGVAARVQTTLAEHPCSGHVFLCRGRHGHFVWPQAAEGAVCLTQAQLSMLLEGIDSRRPHRTQRPPSGL